MKEYKEDMERYKVKGLWVDIDQDGKRITSPCHGFLTYAYGTIPHIEIQDKERVLHYEVFSQTICKNTNIKIKNEYLYEDDLVSFKNNSGNEEIGTIVWDDYRQSYAIKCHLDRTSTTEIRKVNRLEIIGNITLNDEDYKKFSDYSQKITAQEEKEYIGVRQDTECRSKQRLNRLNKYCLPKTRGL